MLEAVEFEWDAAKAEINLRNHSVSFEFAKSVFQDPFGVERLDDRRNYGEERFLPIGMAQGWTINSVCCIYRTQKRYPSYLRSEGNSS